MREFELFQNLRGNGTVHTSSYSYVSKLTGRIFHPDPPFISSSTKIAQTPLTEWIFNTYSGCTWCAQKWFTGKVFTYSHCLQPWLYSWCVRIFTFTGAGSSSSDSLLVSSDFEGIRNVKQSHILLSLACWRLFGKGTIERVTGGGMGGPLGPIPMSSNT